MAEELSYVIVTPYSIRKSRTGGILARLISRTGLDLVAARMFAPSAELVEKYAASIVTDSAPRHRATAPSMCDASHHPRPAAPIRITRKDLTRQDFTRQDRTLRRSAATKAPPSKVGFAKL